MAHSQRFCVIAQARTGSEYLTTRLNEHPEIACHRELFNPHIVFSALGRDYKPRLPSIESRDADPLAALEQVAALSEEAFPDKRVFGFKLFLKHDKQVRQHVREVTRYRLIVLERSNKLAQYVSIETARVTGQWMARTKKDGKPKAAKGTPADAPPVTVEVDTDDLERFIELSARRYTSFNERIEGREGVLHLTSEDLNERFVEVLEFLGVDVSPELRVVRTRQNPAPLADRVLNWDAVATWLDRHGHPEWATA